MLKLLFNDIFCSGYERGRLDIFNVLFIVMSMILLHAVIKDIIEVNMILLLGLALLHGSESWCFKKNEMAIFQRAERKMIRAM